MNKLQYLKIIFTLFILFPVIHSCTKNKSKETYVKPNIIYILADDLGYGDLSVYGQTHFQTPNLDKMAAEGMLFTQHYAGSTVCAPSRSTLLTGMHTGHGYVRFNGDYQMRPDPQDITVARYLKSAGYKTAMIGKSSTGCLTEPGQPNAKGFDHFFGYLGHGQAHAYFPKYLHRNSQQIDFPENGGSKTWTGETYSPDLILDEALTFIKDQKDTSFFLFYASCLPHAQMYVPEEFKKDYVGKFPEQPFSGQHYGTTSDPNATTAGMITRLDWEVGKIMAHLKKLGLDKNTVVMFSSDNGPHKEGGRVPDFFNSSGGFRGIKRDLYEGGIRMPFIVRWPGVIKPGSKSDHISAFWDVLPTLTEIAGVDTPNNIDGISLLPTLKGEDLNQKKHEYLYWEFYEGGGKQAVRKENWKAVKLDARQNLSAPLELYDLSKDPQEQKNIASKNPDIVKEMEEIMRSARFESEVIPFFNTKGIK